MNNPSLDFSKVLDVLATDVKKLSPVPVGTYRCRIVGVHRMEERGKENEKVPVISYQCSIIQPLDDVDQQAIAEYEAVSPLVGKNIRAEWWLGDNTKYLFKAFLVDVCGISEFDSAGEPRKLGEMAAEVPGKQLIVRVTHRNYKNRNNEMETAVEARDFAKV